MFNMSLLCVRLFQQKLWYKLISPAYALSIHKQNALRITKGNNSNRTGPSPFYSNTNVHLMDINVYAKFDEIPSLPVQDI